MKRRAHHVGRLRIRAAAILNKLMPEWYVLPEDIRPATGRWRTDWTFDVYRWELYCVRRKPDGTPNHNLPVAVGCWNTLTQFVREAPRLGMHVEHDVIYLGRTGNG
jgi:hypothetical protein